MHFENSRKEIVCIDSTSGRSEKHIYTEVLNRSITLCPYICIWKFRAMEAVVVFPTKFYVVFPLLLTLEKLNFQE